ncbi:developmental pluripotency-associated protein 3 [Heterocephalus glaber]|uniref:Developmental pluripotency-associated protein 3 n=1 Tax=Heterocephalus glaber TaxID=10181 RepID=A0AAX6S538_HETGA|nr:developmental pluripotency-associated protein 3 [Heterocephalus glaber]
MLDRGRDGSSLQPMEPSPQPMEPVPMAEEAAAVQRDEESSQTLLRDFRNLTLNAAEQRPSPPPTGSPRGSRDSDQRRSPSLGLAAPRVRRRGVRTVLSVRRERMARMLTNARRFVQAFRNERLKGAKDEPRSMPFKCVCSFCVSHAWDPLENTRIGSDYNTESV